jgi:hypothetical protein
MGHKNIQHTVRYTELAPTPVQGLLALSGGVIGRSYIRSRSIDALAKLFGFQE